MASRKGGFSSAALEERCLNRQSRAIPLTHGIDDGVRIDTLMHMQRDRRRFERTMLLLARPHQLRIEMWIVVQVLAGLHRRHWGHVVVNLVRWQNRISFRRHQPDGWVIDALLVGVLIPLDG